MAKGSFKITEENKELVAELLNLTDGKEQNESRMRASALLSIVLASDQSMAISL